MAVGFRNIKAVTPTSAGICTFLGGVVIYMKEMGKEDEALTVDRAGHAECVYQESCGYEGNVGQGAVHSSENAASDDDSGQGQACEGTGPEVSRHDI